MTTSANTDTDINTSSTGYNFNGIAYAVDVILTSQSIALLRKRGDMHKMQRDIIYSVFEQKDVDAAMLSGEATIIMYDYDPKISAVLFCNYPEIYVYLMSSREKNELLKAAKNGAPVVRLGWGDIYIEGFQIVSE